MNIKTSKILRKKIIFMFLQLLYKIISLIYDTEKYNIFLLKYYYTWLHFIKTINLYV